MNRRLAIATLLALCGCIPEGAETPPEAKVEAVDAGPAAAPASDEAPSASKSLLAQVESMKDQLKDKPRDFNVDAALGNLFYDNGKYIDAIEYYSGALDRLSALKEFVPLSPPAVKPGKKPTPIPAECLLDAKGEKPRSVEEVIVFASTLAPKNQDGANACLGQLITPLANVHARRGNSWYLIGNIDKARTDHEAALKLDPNSPEALFFSGAIELETAHGDTAKLAAGKAFWERLLKANPQHPRAELVRQTLPHVDELFGKPRAMPGAETAGAPQLPAGLAESMEKVEHTPEMEAQLDKTTADAEALLDKQQWQAALDMLKTVMPLRPSGRTALGMGIALRELGKPTAERVLMQATRLPGGDPLRAKYELAIFYEKSNPAQAKALLQEIAEDPGIGAKAKARLATLH